MGTSQIKKQLPNEHELNEAQKDELDKKFSDDEDEIGQSFIWEETLAIAKQ